MLLHALIPASRANGPGLRSVVFFQGCQIGCVGCWNPQTHAFHGPEVTVDDVVRQVLEARQEYPLEGITFSGGEPMQQANGLLQLIQGLRHQAPELSFGMFSGYAEHELVKGQYWIPNPSIAALGVGETSPRAVTRAFGRCPRCGGEESGVVAGRREPCPAA